MTAQVMAAKDTCNNKELERPEILVQVRCSLLWHKGHGCHLLGIENYVL